MNVRQFEKDRFFVGSENGEEPYIVDISELDGNSWCSCRDFECRHQPKVMREIEQFGKVLSYRRCKHIQAVLELAKSNNGELTKTKEVVAPASKPTGELTDEDVHLFNSARYHKLYDSLGNNQETNSVSEESSPTNSGHSNHRFNPFRRNRQE